MRKTTCLGFGPRLTCGLQTANNTLAVFLLSTLQGNFKYL